MYVMYVSLSPFFSWKEDAMNKVMKAEVDQNVILRKVIGGKLNLPSQQK